MEAQPNIYKPLSQILEVTGTDMYNKFRARYPGSTNVQEFSPTDTTPSPDSCFLEGVTQK